jgi:putative ABC transport system permease protein
MIKNYLKIALRNLKNNKGFFTLNFVGLYISVSVCALIALIILHELSFDKMTAREGWELYRVSRIEKNVAGKSYEAITQYPLAKALRTELPDEKGITQIHFQDNALFSFGDKKLKVENIVFADSIFPMLFSLTTVKGNLEKALSQPNFAILTEGVAQQFFGNDEAIGKRIRLDNLVDFEVAAIIKQPKNTHLPISVLVPYASLKPEFIGNLPLDQWGVNAAGYTYIGLDKAQKKSQFEQALATVAQKNLNRQGNPIQTNYLLQALSDIHYNQLYAESNVSYTINYEYLYLLGAIGLFLILAACINYTNLSTSLAMKKSKQVGIRKTLGADRFDLIAQFLSETYLLTGLVIFAAAASVYFFIPSVNSFLDKTISTDWLSWQMLLFLVALWVVIGALSGIYPALILSGFNPITALKNKFSSPKTSTVYLRKGLVVFQFLTAQILIIGAIVVAKQMHYINSKPLGFQKERVIDLVLPENKPEQLLSLKNRLQAISGIEKFSFSLGAPISDNGFNSSFNRREKFGTELLDVEVKVADKEYLETYGLTLAAGRWFETADEQKIDNSIPDSLRQYSVVLNEAAVKVLGFTNADEALGQFIQIGLNNLTIPIKGVIKDYHVSSLHAPVAPVAMIQFPFFYYNIGLKLTSNNTQNTLKAVEAAWSAVYPNHLFEANFLDDHIAKLYKEEKRTAQLFNLFTFLSIIINALGLIGLLSFMIEQRTKEIGVRKVLGATPSHISYLLFKDFLALIALAFMIAIPVAAYLMNRWLEDFAYRTSLSWWVFALAGGLALLITVLTVSFQTVKAALGNPIKSLRTE